MSFLTEPRHKVYCASSLLHDFPQEDCNYHYYYYYYVGVIFEKSVKTAVLDSGRPTGALVLTKLVEDSRSEVGHKS